MRAMPRLTGAFSLAMVVGLVAWAPVDAARRLPARPSDFNGDGAADLAIAAPREKVGTSRQAGAVHVLYGSSAGLSAAGDQRWTEDSRGVKGVVNHGGSFGQALSSADFDRDGFADLAITSGGFEGTDRGGYVHVLYGGVSGLTAAGDQRWTQQAVNGDVGTGEIGLALASGDFDHDGYPDLAIGGAFDNGVGSVTVLFGGPDGLTTRTGGSITSDAVGSPGSRSGRSWPSATSTATRSTISSSVRPSKTSTGSRTPAWPWRCMAVQPASTSHQPRPGARTRPASRTSLNCMAIPTSARTPTRSSAGP